MGTCWFLPITREQCEIPLRLRRLQRLDFSCAYEVALADLASALRSQSIAPPPPAGPTGTEPFRQSAIPVSSSVLPRKRSSRRKQLLALWAFAGSALLAGALSWHVLRQGRLLGPPELASPGSKVSKDPTQAEVEAARGQQMIDQYRSTAANRSRLVSVKESWLAAAGNFEKACASGPGLSAVQLKRWHSSAQFAHGPSETQPRLTTRGLPPRSSGAMC